jgi:hypothetical protein
MPGASAVRVGELDKCVLVSCGSVDRIGFVLLKFGSTCLAQKLFDPRCTAARGDAASLRSELTLLLGSLLEAHPGAAAVLVDELDARGF